MCVLEAHALLGLQCALNQDRSCGQRGENALESEGESAMESGTTEPPMPDSQNNVTLGEVVTNHKLIQVKNKHDSTHDQVLC